MRHYEFVFSNGEKKEFEADLDTIQNGTVILAKVKGPGLVAAAGKQFDIVRVISLSNLHDYGYVELPGTAAVQNTAILQVVRDMRNRHKKKGAVSVQ